MGLINTYGSSNRVVESDLTITYGKRRIYGTWTHHAGPYIDTYTQAWELTRSAKKTYKYVGMTLTAAKSCATAMITKYTRDQKDSIWDLNDNGEFAEQPTPSQILMADISIQHANGCMWNVVVNVRETDVRRRIQLSGSVAGYFATENTRDYDTN